MASLSPVRIVVRHVVLNSVGGSALVPGRLQMAIYRTAGMAVKIPDVLSGERRGTEPELAR
jgi:hypothetical protein